MGGIYRDQGDYNQALDYHQKSLKLSEEIQDKLGIASSLLHIGNSYYEQGLFTKSLDHTQKSLAIY